MADKTLADKTLADKTPKHAAFKSKKHIERILGLIALVTLIVAWIVGARWATGNIEPYLHQVVADVDRFAPVAADTYAAYQDDALIAYIAIGEASGYGGPMRVAVAVDLEGNVRNMAIVDHKETPAWFRKTWGSRWVESLLGKSYADGFVLGEDVDAVTGATYTSRAIAEAVRNGAAAVAVSELGLPGVATAAAPFQFGVPEIVLLALFIVGIINRRPKFKYKKQLRWALMLVGLVVLGFAYTQPLTLSMVNKFLLGYWPQWQTGLYGYVLIGGMLLFFIVDGQNPYCEWFCPFGAAQECLGVIGDAKTHTGGKYRKLLMWLQRGLAWLAILLALLFRNPGLTSYEIFGTFFDLDGSMVQFALLGIVLVAAIFIRRPWCRFLCPIHPISDFIRLMRNWIKELWQNAKKV